MVLALAARLELGSSEIRVGEDLAYAIVNEGAARLVCGYAYRLEHRNEQGWTGINRGMAFRAVGLLVDPGDTRQLLAKIPAGTQPGQYRISTTVYQEPPAASPALTLTALFRVR